MKAQIIKPLKLDFLVEQIIVWTPNVGEPDHHVHLDKNANWLKTPTTHGRWNVYYKPAV